MEELGIEGACNRLWDCWDAYGATDGVEVEASQLLLHDLNHMKMLTSFPLQAEGLLQQIQLYNVALKQEDGEPVTEDEIRQVDLGWFHNIAPN